MVRPVSPESPTLLWSGVLSDNVAAGSPAPAMYITNSSTILHLWMDVAVGDPVLVDSFTLPMSAVAFAHANGVLIMVGYDGSHYKLCNITVSGNAIQMHVGSENVSYGSSRAFIVSEDGNSVLLENDTGTTIYVYSSSGDSLLWSASTPWGADPRVDGTIVAHPSQNNYLVLNTSPSTFEYVLTADTLTQTANLPGSGDESASMTFTIPDLSGETILSVIGAVDIDWSATVGFYPTGGGVLDFSGVILSSDLTTATSAMTSAPYRFAAVIPYPMSTVSSVATNSGAGLWVYAQGYQFITVDNSGRGSGTLGLYDDSGTLISSVSFAPPTGVWIGTSTNHASFITHPVSGVITVQEFNCTSGSIVAGPVTSITTDWSSLDNLARVDAYDGQVIIGPTRTGGGS